MRVDEALQWALTNQIESTYSVILNDTIMMTNSFSSINQISRYSSTDNLLIQLLSLPNRYNQFFPLIFL